MQGALLALVQEERQGVLRVASMPLATACQVVVASVPEALVQEELQGVLRVVLMPLIGAARATQTWQLQQAQELGCPTLHPHWVTWVVGEGTLDHQQQGAWAVQQDPPRWTALLL